MEIFNASKSFPKEEKYSLTDQIRRSSRSIVANIAEGFRKRQYPKMFVSKLADADGETAENQDGILPETVEYMNSMELMPNFQRLSRLKV